MNSAAAPTTPEATPPAVSPPRQATDFPPTGTTGKRAMRLDLYDNSDFDRGAGKLKEACWILCKALFFLPPLPWPSRLRVALLRLFGAKIGRGVVIRSGVNITFPWRLKMGDHVWIGDEVFILSLAPVSLGSHVCLSQRAFLCTGSHDWRRETFDLETRPIIVEDRVWVSAMVFVGPGVRIGEGTVVGAGSVVMKSVPTHSMVKVNRTVPSVRKVGGEE